VSGNELKFCLEEVIGFCDLPNLNCYWSPRATPFSNFSSLNLVK